MKKFLKILLIFLFIVLIIGFSFYFLTKSKKTEMKLPKQKNMKLTSPAFEQNQFIPQKYTCDGQDINPPLKIEGLPEKTKSLVLIVDDPDAPRGTFTHWIVLNIDPKISEIEENSVPKGALQGINDFGKNSYNGPCPPFGLHHYHFKLYALETELNLDKFFKKSDLEEAMKNHILDWTELIGLYQR